MTDTIAILQSLQPAAFDAGAVFSGTPSGKYVKGYAARRCSLRLLTGTTFSRAKPGHRGLVH